MVETRIGELAAPFDSKDIEWRVQRSGMKQGKPWAMVLAYVTNRAIQQRLDDVVGPLNWKNDFKPGPTGGVLCGISIKNGNDWITKWDGADNTKVEEVKGGLSSSMKRAAVQWGIGRYLYNLDSTFVGLLPKGKNFLKVENITGYWNDPELPDWALPKKEFDKKAPF